MIEVRSMTGFAAVDVDADKVGETGFRLTIKGVNHRFLDLALRLPAGCDALEAKLRQRLKERLRRGHVELTVSVERGGASGAEMRVDDVVLGEYVAAFREAARRHGLREEPELHAMLRMPGVMMSADAGSRREISAKVELAILRALDGLLEEFDQTREQEGASLRRSLEGSLARLRVLAEEARVLRTGVRDAHVDRLHARMRELVNGVSDGDAAGVQARLLLEAALLAERSDVEEELVRLGAHTERFLTVLAEGGEVGKRLDFLSQEMNREANTVLSKTGSAAGQDGLRLTEIGLECKAEIERMREQVQNLE